MDDALGAVCPPGMVHRYRGVRQERVSGYGLQWWDTLLDMPDVYRPNGRICLATSEDPATGSPRVTFRDSGGSTVRLLNPVEGATFVKGTWLGGADIGQRIEGDDVTYTAPPIGSQAVRFLVDTRLSGVRRALGDFYSSLVDGRTEWLDGLDPFIWQDRYFKFGAPSDAVMDAFVGYFPWRDYRGSKEAWDEFVVPELEKAQNVVIADWAERANGNAIRSDLDEIGVTGGAADDAVYVRTPPRMGPMHGVHPAAKAIPTSTVPR